MRKSSYPNDRNTTMPVEYQVSSKYYEETKAILTQAEKIRRMREEFQREMAEFDKRRAA